jgi:predicted nucleotidyltransferase
MISEKDKQAIREISQKYHARRVLLFGSSLSPSKESRDIDIAVEGIAAEDFFRFYGDLMFALSKPVDVVDLSVDSKFIRIIRKEGVPLYG